MLLPMGNGTHASPLMRAFYVAGMTLLMGFFGFAIPLAFGMYLDSLSTGDHGGLNSLCTALGGIAGIGVGLVAMLITLAVMSRRR